MANDPKAIPGWLLALFAAPAVAFGVWWYFFDSSHASLKDGEYSCSSPSSAGGVPIALDPRLESTATVENNRVVAFVYTSFSMRDGSTKQRGAVKSFTLEERAGRSKFTATIDGSTVACEHAS